ncbi:MAG TPA: HEAT repeat domain-containing protein [Elusimicrobiales bacterium]|nr:HEAT repeat domain-containing protein [Elusimicrobiales bacterium]HOL62691.1 HEAT repeat domain-containing protein [Elusimicrobiales bacterium]HPO95027.1 HEAT repeat domain-containing protein [Elusimicrobiales bacterium]
MRKLKNLFFVVIILMNLNLLVFSKNKKTTDTQQSKNSSQTASNPDSPSKKALNIIVSHIKNGDSDVKSYAIEALSKTHNPKLIPIIKKYLNDQSKYVKISTVKALWELGDVGSISKLYEVINDIPSENALANDPLTQIKIISQNKIREKAIETLVDLIGIKANKTLLDLKENDNFAQIRDVASRELAKIGYKNEIENFYNALNSKDEEIRNQAAISLVRICPEDGSKIIATVKKEKSIRVKMLLLDSLKCAKLNKKDEEEIIKYSEDENQTLRYKAISVLSNSNNDYVIQKLKKTYEDSPDINIKLLILKKLLSEQNITLTESDAEYLNSIDKSEIKRRFIEISNFIPKISEKYLINYLEDQDPYVQIDSAIKIIEMESKND